MLTLMLSTQNQREQQILEVALKQQNFEVKSFDPAYVFFVKLLQYLPDIIMMELPPDNYEHLKFINLVRRHKKLSRIPIIAYGSITDKSLIKGILKQGASEYILRPLKISVLMQYIQLELRKNGKSALSSDKTDPPPQFDITMLTDMKVLPLKKIQAMSDHVGKLLAFPFTVPRVLQFTASSDKGATDLAKVIEADPVISTQILKIANTVFFASASRRISTLKDALVRIGFNETRRIVMGLSVMKLFDERVRNAGFDRTDFWYHSLACAVIAERLARRMDQVNGDEVFLAGLVHDLGLLVLDEYFPEIMAMVLEKTTENAVDFTVAEKAMLGITHLDVTVELFSRWRMHEDITQAVLDIDRFNELATKSVDTAQKMAICIGLAETLAKTVYLGRECDEFVNAVDNEVFTAVKMQTGFSDSFLQDVYQDMLFYRKFFNLEQREFPTRHEGLENAQQLQIGVVNASGSIFMPHVLYLNKEGVTSEMLPPQEKPSIADGRFDLIIIYSNERVPVEFVERYTHTVRRRDETVPVTGDEEIRFTPVLVCIDSNSTLPEAPELANVSFVSKSIDMRKIERAMCEIAAGRHVVFISNGQLGNSIETKEDPSLVPAQ